MSSGASHKPYVAAETAMREVTVRGLVAGSLLGILFAASSVYLGLKIGLTVSASIPIAVLSITIFRAFGRATILENNIVQTTGSAGESIAAGVAFTLPSLLLMGQDLEYSRVLLVALLGGLLGVLMMIPLRHGLIVKEHGKLTYPEGTACADVLIVGEQGGTNAKTVFLGAGVGFGYAILNQIVKLWKETAGWMIRPFRGASIAVEVAPAMIGVGYIIGPRTAANMMAGGALAFLILIPLIYVFGSGLDAPIYPATKLIRDMSPGEMRNAYILYIGAGAVATGGIINLLRAMPTIVAAFRRGLGAIGAAAGGAVPRTERDLPMAVVAGGSLVLVGAIWLAPNLQINLVSAILIVLFGFFFVTVSSRITGEIGSSSNPISGMTVATLLITCLLFLAVDWTGPAYRAMALTTAAIVCVAASNGGTISQDLKTGFLVGGTPSRQQASILVGVVTSAAVIGGTLLFLNKSATTYRDVSADYPGYVARAEADAQTMAYRGKTYRVHYQPEPGIDVPMGKYLVDGAGKLAYLVDPGVCGTDLDRVGDLTAAEGKGAMVAVSPDARVRRVDGVAYREVKLDAPTGSAPAGSYLANDAGQISFRLDHVAKYDAPKARLFALIIDGILTQKLPWALVLVGVFLALMMELVGVSSLPFAVGCYLPISTSTPIFVGGLVRLLVDKKTRTSAAEAELSPGVLLSSGLIAGGAIAGILYGVAEWAIADGKVSASTFDRSAWLGPLSHSDEFAMIPFLGLAVLLYWIGTRATKSASA
jgi:putative OPT family oligopeptide transporter